MPSTTLDKSTDTTTSKKHYPDWKVIVLNDEVNTFEHVTKSLVQVLPQMTPDTAWNLATTIHESGAATVWSGALEQAEMYHMQLGVKGLTMAPLEQDG
jgi:ATP-dependent Clp protease adaptor protein ClpS